MEAKDFDLFFAAPAFIYLGIVCFAIAALSLVALFVLHTGYLVLGFIFFVLGYIALRIGISKSRLP